MNPNFEVLNGSEINWGNYTKSNLLSIAFWLICIVGIQFIKGKWRISGIKYISYFLSLVQLVTLVITIAMTDQSVSRNYVISKKREFELSSEENIVVFVVDTLDAVWFEEMILRDEPDRFRDFTYFDNAVAGGAPTLLGIPLILTGERYDRKRQIRRPLINLSAAYLRRLL